MIFWDKIFTDLIGVVGWRQSTASGAVVVDDANLASSSGLYVQGASPLVTVENIKASQPDKAISDVNMNALLVNLMKDGISNVFNFVFPQRDVFSNQLLYPYEMDFTDEITNFSGFVGYEIITAKRSDIAIILNKVMLQFATGGTVKLLLFNSNTNALITSKTITVTANTTTTSVLDWVMGYITAPGGKYYLGYLTSTAPGYAYNRSFDNADMKSHFNSVVFKPIYVTGWTSETLFDVNNIEYTEKTHGINLDVSTVFDVSNLILQNKDKFAKAIQLATAVEAINVMTTTNRRNETERMILFNGVKTVVNSPEIANIYAALENEMKRLKGWFEPDTIEKHTIR